MMSSTMRCSFEPLRGVKDEPLSSQGHIPANMASHASVMISQHTVIYTIGASAVKTRHSRRSHLKRVNKKIRDKTSYFD